MDPALVRLLDDPVYLLRLRRRLCAALARQDGRQQWQLSPAFAAVEARQADGAETLSWAELVALARAALPPPALSDSDVAVAVAMLLPDAEAGADAVTLLAALRRLLPLRAWQVSRAVERARAAVFSSDAMSAFEEHWRDLSGSPDAPPLSAKEMRRFLTRTAGLAAPEALLLTEYCAGGGGALDAGVVGALLFSESVPSREQYPLLAAQLCEGAAWAADGKDGAAPGLSGTRALRAALKQQLGDAYVDGALTPRQFFNVGVLLRAGLTQPASDQLFRYAAGAAPTLPVRALLAVHRDYFPPVGLSALQLVRHGVGACVRRAGDPLAFLRLYEELAPCGTGVAPLDAVVAGLRARGVSPESVTDIELEWLRMQAPTRTALLHALCCPPPPAREAVIAKLYERLGDGGGDATAVDLLARLQPERNEAPALRRVAEGWQRHLRAYLAELELAHTQPVTREIFDFFWALASAGVDDDPSFTVLVWQSYAIAGAAAAGRTPRGGRR